jgi:tape measure domain-containing protein
LASFADLTARLNLNITNFATNLQRAAGQANRFAANLQGQINTGMIEPTKKAKFEFKDVARIVQGIIISKAFYSGLNSIRNATDAVWEFSKSIEYAQMVYSTLFRSTDLATEFINVLQDFAAITPFTFTQAEQAAKRLLAYGIQYQNVMYVMQGVLAASTAQQKPEVIESISRALGQIYTKGRLMNEEMRQLAEAGIPVYEILQEKLGLTTDQLRNLGREAIPANDAINALVDGINERFGVTLQMSSLTTTGIISNIKDNALMLFSGIFSPFTSMLHDMLASFGEFIFALREAYQLRGIGGVFETLIPPELQGAVRTLIANLLNLWNIVKTNVIAIFNAFKKVLKALVNVLNVVLPIFNVFAGFLAAFTKVITENDTAMRILIGTIVACAAAWAVYRLQALVSAAVIAVINATIKAVKALSIALTFLVAHPIWALLALGVGLFVGLTGASDRFAASVRKLFSSFSSFGGIDSDKILLPDSKERANDLGKFNKRLDGTSDAMDSLAASTGKATKAAKGLLGFDEVFSIKTPDTGDVGGITDELDDMVAAINNMAIDPKDIFKDVNFDGMANNFVNNVLDAFGGKSKIMSAGIGSIIGGALGGLLGGPIGARIGFLVGGIAGWFWDDLAKALELTDTGKLAIPIATALGIAIGTLIGGPAGAIIAGGIGILTGWIIDRIARGLETGNWTGVGVPVGMGIGLAIGSIIGGPAGAVLGISVGGLVGYIVDGFIHAFHTGDWSTISVQIGTGLGMAIGGIVGGPVGILIGGAIGTLVGWIISKLSAADWSAVGEAFLAPWKTLGTQVATLFTEWIWDPIKNAFDTGDWGSFGVNIVLGILKGIFLGISAVPTAIVTLFASFWSAICEIFGIQSPATTMLPIGQNIVLGILLGLTNTVGQLIAGLIIMGAQVLSTVSTWLLSVGTAFTTWSASVLASFTSWLNNIITNLKTWTGTFSSTLQTLFSNVLVSVTTFVSNSVGKFTSFFNTLGSTVKSGVANIYASFKSWIDNLWSGVFGKLFSWIESGISKLKDFFGMSSKASSINVNYSGIATPRVGHAVGGVFNREHVAKFAEGNKKEAIIPLENETAMEPFVTAVANGVAQVLMPIAASMQNRTATQGTQDLRPLYVGTLIADDRSLKELDRRMKVIQISESQRRG